MVVVVVVVIVSGCRRSGSSMLYIPEVNTRIGHPVGLELGDIHS